MVSFGHAGAETQNCLVQVSEDHVLVCPSVLVRKLCRKSFCESTEVPEKLVVCMKHVLPCCLSMSRHCM